MSESVGYDARRRCRTLSEAAEVRPTERRPVLSGGPEAHRLVTHAVAVDAVGLEERAASLAKRSIKRSSKLWALDLAIRCMDLTTLEGTDTVGKVTGKSASTHWRQGSQARFSSSCTKGPDTIADLSRRPGTTGLRWAWMKISTLP